MNIKEGLPALVAIIGIPILLTYLSLTNSSSPSAAEIRATPTPVSGPVATPDSKTAEFLSSIDPALLSGCKINKEDIINLDTQYGTALLNPASVPLNSLQANKSEAERIYLKGIVVGKYDSKGKVQNPKLCVKDGNEIKFRKLIATESGYSWETPVALEPEFKLEQGEELLQPGTVVALHVPGTDKTEEVTLYEDVSATTYKWKDAGEGGLVTGQFVRDPDGNIHLRVPLPGGGKDDRPIVYKDGRFYAHVPTLNQIYGN